MALVELGLALTPGPNMVYLVSRSVSQGRAAGLVSLIGTAVGFVVYMASANLGLAVVFIAVPWLYIGLKAVGAAYLAFLAWQTLRPGGRGLFEPRSLQRDSHWRLFRMGLITNLLNPKVAILYLALIPQFIDPARGHTTAQGFALGAVQIAVGLTVNGLIVLAAGSVAALLKSRPAWAKWQRWATGSLLGVVAIALAREVPARARV
ncbi:LysE family translocator [Streptomyces kanamyceticus]|uniref:LysE family translocator n=2 Tax=Streptomyces kanamyceticus TaxID=1967 RepID=A0A5J6G9H7_STRKN|nr:LysE family translocator [Streptomyces kanamyceticus]QEU89876.1 LysE family translocator [Streptomyces kanamyceticus]